MDIANRMGFGTAPHMTKLAKFAVALSGLTDNAAFGPCALRGTPVLAEVSDGDDPLPTGISYQWHSVADGPIAGATGASFVPDAPLADEAVIFCVVTVPGRGSRTSARAVLRDAVPQVEGALFDEVFDVDTGPQVVAASSVFTGLNLRYAVTGVGAIIDPITGDISVLTDVERDGDIITVMATNSGGTASAAFQVTVEDVAAGEALPFGGLTPAGAGGIKVDGTSVTGGDPGGHWEITDGFLVPSAAGEGALSGFYALVFNNGDTLDVMIEDDKASARADEIVAVYDSLPLTARGLMVQDGDARAMGRIRLAPKVFEREMVLEPTNWIEDADPRQSLRPVTLAGLAIGGDPSGDQILRMENLTVQGLIFQMQAGGGETEGNNGIIRVERPSRHVIIRQNEIWSRDTREIVEANDYRDNFNTSRQMRGIATSVYRGMNEHICIEDNHIHSVSRGVTLTATGAYEGVRSRFCGNYIEHCYTNFFTAGFFDGLDIFDNYCMGVYAALEDTLGTIPQDSPHSAAGGSFDTSGSRRTQNTSVMGNFLHIGWLRTAICAELGLAKPSIGATGMKFNDPRAGDSYYNLVVAFNTIVAHGPSLEISGSDADTHNLVFNNSLIYEDYAANGSPPTFSFGGAQKIRFFNNLSTGYYINTEDGDSGNGLGRTLNTLEGYGNLNLGVGSGNGFGETNYFVGDPAKGIVMLTIDEALAAYIPKADTRALSAEQKKGALGTGLYHGNGIHDVVWNKITPTGGTGHPYAMTDWNGQYIRRSGNAAMLNTGTLANGLTFAFQGEGSPDVDGVSARIFSMSGQRVSIEKFGNGTLQFKAESGNSTFIKGYAHGARINSNYGKFNYIVSIDFDRGVIIFAINGAVVDWYIVNTLDRKRLSLNANTPRVFADELSSAGSRWKGKLGVFFLADSFVDLETQGGINSFFAEDGQFRDFGPDGSAPLGIRPLIYLKDNVEEVGNLGTGGEFVLDN